MKILENKSSFNSYELTKRLNELDKRREPSQPYKGMGIHKVIIEDFIEKQIHKYGMISGMSI